MMQLLLMLFSYFAYAKLLSYNDALTIARCFVLCNNITCRESCKDYHLESQIEVPVRLSTEANASVMLHCKDGNYMSIKHNPGVYVVEQRSEKSFLHNFQVSSGEFTSFSNLTSDTKYQYFLYRVTNEGISHPEVSMWFKTNAENYRPMEVKNISVNQITVDENDVFDLAAEINFEPAEDVCCSYNVLLWSELTLFQIALKAFSKFQVRLRSLEYNRNNTVYIISRNGLIESKNVSYTFLTPTCLEIHKNLKNCAPPEVSGLIVKYSNAKNGLHNIIVQWDEPYFIPDSYSLLLESENSSEVAVDIEVPGNQTEAVFPNVKIEEEYLISIIAESEGGISEKVTTIATKEKNYAYNEAFVVLLAATIVTILLSVLTYIYCKRKKQLYKAECKYLSVINPQNSQPDTVKSPVKSEICGKFIDKFEIPKEQLTLKHILGSGICGVVKLASLRVDHDKIDVAVKMLKDNASSEDFENFQHEIDVLKSVGKHKNIVSLIGVCTLVDQVLLIVEYCCKGDLQSYLKSIWEIKTFRKSNGEIQDSSSRYFLGSQENKNSKVVENRLYDIQSEALDLEEVESDLLNYAEQIAVGMEFLALNRIVHRDLAARNILVCKNKTVKISDFGLSRDIYQENVYKKQGNGKLPIKWMAIEALTHQIYTTHSDVWSFGILLWEIVTLGCNPYPGLPTNKVLRFLKSGYRMEKPVNCGIELYRIMLSCWETNPISRPTFTELKDRLHSLLNPVTNSKYLNISDASTIT